MDYINNLHREDYKDVYTTVEKIVAQAIPLKAQSAAEDSPISSPEVLVHK